MSKRKCLFERHDTYYDTGIPCGNPKRVQTGEVLRMPDLGGARAGVAEPSEMENLQTEGDRQLKAMAQKQLRKDITMTELASERRHFTGAGQFKPVTAEIKGIMGLQAYQEVSDGDSRIESLRQCGLSEDEIRLKLAAEGNVVGLHNTATTKSTYGENPDVQQERLRVIDAKIKEKQSSLQKPDTFRGIKEVSRQELDLERSLFSGADRDNADLSHMLTKQKVEVEGDPNDPINKLPQMMAEIEERAQEKIRQKRRWRKRNRKNKHNRNEGACAETADGCSGDNNAGDGDDDDDDESRVIGCLTREETLALAGTSAESSKSTHVPLATDTSCPLPKDADISKGSEFMSAHLGTPGMSVADIEKGTAEEKFEAERKVIREHVEILPEEFIEENRLNVEDIRQLPKFKNYEAGNPSNVLYLKNLSPRVSEHDLVSLFGRYQKGPESEVVYKLMTGRMRGQAFITFADAETATQALHLVNGFTMRGKPLIAQYGKRTAA